MGFRMTDSPFPRDKPQRPRHRCRWLSISIRLYHTIRAFQCTVSDLRWRPRPSLLAILRERLFLNSESEGPLAIRDMRRFVTAGDGLGRQIPGEGFRSRFFNDTTEFV